MVYLFKRGVLIIWKKGWRATVRVQGETEYKLQKKAKKKAAMEEKAASEESPKKEGEDVEKLAEEVEKVEIKEEEEKVSDKEKEKNQRYEDEGCEYFIATKAGKAEDVIEGLINLADRLLRIGGRLVFLFPVDKSK
jgi:uncharacterized protein YwgA